MSKETSEITEDIEDGYESFQQNSPASWTMMLLQMGERSCCSISSWIYDPTRPVKTAAKITAAIGSSAAFIAILNAIANPDLNPETAWESLQIALGLGGTSILAFLSLHDKLDPVWVKMKEVLGCHWRQHYSDPKQPESTAYYPESQMSQCCTRFFCEWVTFSSFGKNLETTETTPLNPQ